MPMPNLLHPTRCRVRPIDRAATTQDNSLREPVQLIARRPTLEFEAQVEMRAQGGMGLTARDERKGFSVDESGYLLVRRIDIEALGYDPQIGDEFIETSGSGDVSLKIRGYLTKTTPSGHYPEHGYTLVKLFFGARKPARPT